MANPRHPIGRAFRFFLTFAGLVAIVAFLATMVGGDRLGGGIPAMEGLRVALVPLRGEITTSDDFVETLHAIGENESIGAVVVRVDSPGGAVAPSQEMYQAVRRLREVKPVVASLGAVAASGGYYVASAADVVVANPGSLTGSIGVIMQMTNLEGLMSKVGVQAEVVTAGSQKDMGSPFRPLTDSEREIFQSMADDVHRQFIDAVASGRNLSPAGMDLVSSGRIFTGQQALKVGLVDELGGLHEAVAIAGQRAGIEGEPDVEKISPSRVPWWLQTLFADQASLSFEKAALERFMGGVTAWAAASGDRGVPLFLWRTPVVTDGLRW